MTDDHGSETAAFMKPAELAQHWNVSAQHVRNLMRLGLVPYVVVGAGTLREARRVPRWWVDQYDRPPEVKR